MSSSRLSWEGEQHESYWMNPKSCLRLNLMKTNLPNGRKHWKWQQQLKVQKRKCCCLMKPDYARWLYTALAVDWLETYLPCWRSLLMHFSIMASTLWQSKISLATSWENLRFLLTWHLLPDSFEATSSVTSSSCTEWIQTLELLASYSSTSLFAWSSCTKTWISWHSTKIKANWIWSHLSREQVFCLCEQNNWHSPIVPSSIQWSTYGPPCL